MKNKICQSCGMPMMTDDQFGSNEDGSLNTEYCAHCYQNGTFAWDCTMDEMIEHNLEFLDEFNKDADRPFTKEEARAGMKEYFPTLKRWKN